MQFETGTARKKDTPEQLLKEVNIIFIALLILALSEYWTAHSFSLSMSTTKKHQVAIHWFRKGLRLHDNPSLLEACTASSKVYPIFIIDPWFAKPDKVGINRYSFLLESLTDLDTRYKANNLSMHTIQHVISWNIFFLKQPAFHRFKTLRCEGKTRGADSSTHSKVGR